MKQNEVFDLAIIGAGSYGLSLAAASGLGLKVALIESHKIG